MITLFRKDSVGCNCSLTEMDSGEKNMNWKLAMACLGLALAASSQAWGLSLNEYVNQVRGQSLQGQQLRQEAEAATLEQRSADLIFTPTLFFNAETQQDESLPTMPVLTYDRFDTNQYSLGVSQQFSFGLQAQLSYRVMDIEYVNPSIPGDLKFTDAKPVVELSMPLLRGGFGRTARNRELAIRSQSKANRLQSEAQFTSLDIEAEGIYWRCAAAKEAVDVQTRSLKSAEDVRDYVSKKARMELGENSDVIQASALVEARKLQLLQAQNEAVATAQALNALLNINSSEIPAMMDPIKTEEVLAISIAPSRPGNRSDVDAAQAQTELAKANSEIVADDTKPSLDVYGSYGLFGRADGVGDANSNISKSDRDTKVIGLRFSMPLNLGAESDVKKAARLRGLSAETSYRRAILNQDIDWSNLVRRINESKQNLKLATTVEDIQKRKLETEKKRLRQGRTTTYQVLLFEQDYLDAQLSRVRNAAQILTLSVQTKAYKNSSSPAAASTSANGSVK